MEFFKTFDFMYIRAIVLSSTRSESESESLVLQRVKAKCYKVSEV